MSSRTATRLADDAKLAELDARLAGPSCERCGLHGAHLCTSVSLIELASQRDGSYPLPVSNADDDSDAPVSKVESLTSARKRHHMDKERLRKMLFAAGFKPKDPRRWMVERSVVDRLVAMNRKRRARP